MDHFIFENNEIKKVDTFKEWKERKMTHESDRIIKKTQVTEHILVSTIFDGVGSNRFESVIFDKNKGELDQDSINCSTFDEALQAHNEQVNKVCTKEK